MKTVVRQLDELRQRIGLEAEGKLVAGGAPVGDCRGDAQEELESGLNFLSGVAEVVAPSGAGPRQEVLDQPHAHVVSHSF